jgi:hypothetical protein
MSNSQWGLAQAHQEVVDAVQAVAEEVEFSIMTAGQTVSPLVERAQSSLDGAKSFAGNDRGWRSQISQILISGTEPEPGSFSARGGLDAEDNRSG